MSSTKDYEQIIMNQIPLIDVRAPIEYEKGAFLNAVNLPIMNDEERHLIGIRYKEKGNASAIELGHQLVSGDIKEERIKAWHAFINQNPNAMMYCFRGGQRSQISQNWIYDYYNIEIPRLEGGYKAFRQYLIQALEPSQQTSLPIILSGYTGSGKTQIIEQLENAIDLEGIANHRGSTFGHYINPQPSQINFENNLAYALIEHQLKGYQYLILEDEGTHVGKRFIPRPLVEFFRSNELVIVDVPFEERVLNTLNEYVIDSQALYMKHYGEERGLEMWSQYIIASFNKMLKRLGNDLHKRLVQSFQHAFDYQLKTNQFEHHKDWIEILLKEYYDPMYRYQMERNNQKHVFTGNREEVIDYLKTLK